MKKDKKEDIKLLSIDIEASSTFEDAAKSDKKRAYKKRKSPDLKKMRSKKINSKTIIFAKNKTKLYEFEQKLNATNNATLKNISDDSQHKKEISKRFYEKNKDYNKERRKKKYEKYW